MKKKQQERDALDDLDNYEIDDDYNDDNLKKNILNIDEKTIKDIDIDIDKLG